MPSVDGLVVVDKPPDWTSHDVVARMRGIADTRKVGHAGTLDPMATGVLVLGLGRATRLLGYLSGHSKAYDATIRLGQSTTTDDAHGETAGGADASGLDRHKIEAAAARLTGTIEQVPSAVSAIKVDGRRAYRRVRDGEQVELTPRRVTIQTFAVLGLRRLPAVVDVDVQVECTAGTYVRALARDLGTGLGVGGHLTRLRRTRSGRYGIDQARTLEQLALAFDVVSLDDVASGNFATYTLGADAVFAARNGRPLRADLPRASGRTDRDWGEAADRPVAMMTPDGEFVALYEQHGPLAKPVAVFPPPSSSEG
jgi:tRNA pseudouridine55 synthase